MKQRKKQISDLNLREKQLKKDRKEVRRLKTKKDPTNSLLSVLLKKEKKRFTVEDTRVQTAIDMKQVAEPYIRRRAIRHIEKGRIVIFAAGTGLPYFSTDTTAALRAVEINADVILAGKRGTDGIYDSDPNKNKNAIKYDKLTYIDILNKGLGIMDATATSLCMENNMGLVVFGIDDPKNIIRVSHGENIGTIVEGDKNE